MPRVAWMLVVFTSLLAAIGIVTTARANHGIWETETVWVEPVIETRTVWVPGYEEEYTVWLPGRYETQTRVIEVQEWQASLVWVPSGHWEERRHWVESGYWEESWDPFDWVPHGTWVDTSHWEIDQVWVDTSQWEDHGAWVTVQREEVTTVWVPGSWTTMRRWVAGYYETTEVVVVPGHYDTQNTWVTLPHPAPTPNPPPASPPTQTPETGGDCAVPAGIYKVTDYYAGTDVQQTDESIHYLTVTDDRPNDLYAVDLGSYGKGVAGPYDGAAFNGRHRDVNGDLLAGTFYQNYRKRDGCYVPTSIVFFQDDRVLLTTGALPGVTPVSSPTPTPTAILTSTPTAILTSTPTAILTSTPTAILTSTPTAILTSTPTATSTSTPTAISTSTPTATSTSTPEVTPTTTSVTDVSPSPASDPDAPVPPSQPPPGGPVPSPKPTSQPTVGSAPAPTSGPVPTATPVAHDPPAGTIRVAPVLAGSAVAGDTEGFLAIEVLRGAPIDLWVRAAVDPPSSDPGATTALQQWTFLRGANDRPGGTRPGDIGRPDETLRMQWNDVTPIVDGHFHPYDLHLRARIRVTYSDRTLQDFELEGSIAVTVRYQGATSWVDRR